MVAWSCDGGPAPSDGGESRPRARAVLGRGAGGAEGRLGHAARRRRARPRRHPRDSGTVRGPGAAMRSCARAHCAARRRDGRRGRLRGLRRGGGGGHAEDAPLRAERGGHERRGGAGLAQDGPEQEAEREGPALRPGPVVQPPGRGDGIHVGLRHVHAQVRHHAGKRAVHARGHPGGAAGADTPGGPEVVDGVRAEPAVHR
mmetsp:Transcript_36406/g.102635  ORF Transcript_36406/g.102635 Transcript_36406/m.102635 type:complete len:201 (-) Transcript_36406:994-1596(-)